MITKLVRRLKLSRDTEAPASLHVPHREFERQVLAVLAHLLQKRPRESSDPFYALALSGRSCQYLPLEWQEFVQTISRHAANSGTDRKHTIRNSAVFLSVGKRLSTAVGMDPAESSLANNFGLVTPSITLTGSCIQV